MQTQLNKNNVSFIPLEIPSMDFPQIQKSLSSHINRIAQMPSLAYDIVDKAIFSRIIEAKNLVGEGIVSILKFFFCSNYDTRSKLIIALGMLLATMRVMRAIYETVVNPTNIVKHFPTFLALCFAAKYCAKN